DVERRLNHERREKKEKSGKAHRENRVEIAVMGMRGGAGPFGVLLGAIEHRRRIPEGQKAMAEYRAFDRLWQGIGPDVGASGEGGIHWQRRDYRCNRGPNHGAYPE